MLQKNKYKIKHQFNFNILLLILIPLVLIGTTIAKYVREEKSEKIYQAQSFYFYSDLLSDNTNPLAYTYETGKDNISIILNNNIDDLRYSEVDIDYVVTITDTYGNEIKNKNGESVDSKKGTLQNDGISSQQIEFTNLPTGIYIITAKATSPYTKTLHATFVLSERNQEISYQINDSINSPVLQLTVLTEDYSGDVVINWPEGIQPDSTNPKFSNVNTGENAGSTIIYFEPKSEYIFQFFKSQPNSIYTKENFKVERSQ